MTCHKKEELKTSIFFDSDLIGEYYGIKILHPKTGKEIKRYSELKDTAKSIQLKKD